MMLMLSQSKDGGKKQRILRARVLVPVLLQLRITWNPRIFPFENKRLIANNNSKA